MALSPEAAALKEQALDAADVTLIAAETSAGWHDLDYTEARVLLAAAWLSGYRRGQMEHDRYVDEARFYLLALSSGVGYIGR